MSRRISRQKLSYLRTLIAPLADAARAKAAEAASALEAKKAQARIKAQFERETAPHPLDAAIAAAKDARAQASQVVRRESVSDVFVSSKSIADRKAPTSKPRE